MGYAVCRRGRHPPSLRRPFLRIPDIRYQQDDHFVDGDRGSSEWTLSGTTTDGQRIEVRGCDLWTLRDGKVVKKDSYWKIRTTG